MKNKSRMTIAFFFLINLASSSWAAEISFTMDDPSTTETPLLSLQERNDKILSAFKHHHIHGALFVCGKRIDSDDGKKLIEAWDRAGHLIANHSYSHLSLNSDDITIDQYEKDFLKNEPLITKYKHFVKLYRFPFLKEGNTSEKRDEMRNFLKEHGYKNGYVTIDASDWYVDQRLQEKLKDNPTLDLQPYRDFYLQHMWDRAQYYDNLAKQIYSRAIKHTILIHHSLLNALFLNDLMDMFVSKGWKLVSAEKAFGDPISDLHPNIVPAGESLIWELAKETKKFDHILRYPGEDGDYEKPQMDKLGL